jgi:hypothetical protein
MSSDPVLTKTKRLVSKAVLTIDGVSGVGLPAQGLTIYLEKDEPGVRKRVAIALAKLRLTTPVRWEVTGRLKAR